jgi:hypothetical protein
MRIDGQALSFVDTRFSAADLPAKVAAVVGPVERIETELVPLRSIYTSLARAMRNEQASA